jgi:LysR family glycine cleavage system transcriptional activator
MKKYHAKTIPTMTRRLPPLNALRSFEAAARHLSFRAAAQELNVTPSAVSHQVKSLESYMGVALFHRLTRQVRLTDAGRTYLPALGAAFDQIDAATRQLALGAELHPLVISVTPTFATEWLVPRLTGFQTQHPDIELRISTARDVPDFAATDVELAIPIGDGHWPGLEARLLIREEVVPVCSPDLLERFPALCTSAGLANATLIHVMTRPDQWAAYLRIADLEGVANPARGPTVQNTFLALEAAMSGLGVALGNRRIIGAHLAVNRLVVPFELEIPIGTGYYMVNPVGAGADLRIGAFQRWVLSELDLPETPG